MPKAHRERRSNLTSALAGFGVAAISFFVGVRIGPLVYPYKQYGYSFYDDLMLRLEDLGEHFTYIGPYALHGYAIFVICFLISFYIVKLTNRFLNVVYGLSVGAYIDVTLNWSGRQVYDLYEGILGFRPEDQTLALIGYYLSYIAAIFGPPLALAYMLSLVQRRQLLSRTGLGDSRSPA